MSLQYPIDDGGGVGGGIGGGGSAPPPPSPPPPTPAVPTPPPPPTSSIVPAIVASAERNGGSVSLSRIPLGALPSQNLYVQLGNQTCRLKVYQKLTGLYLDLDVDNVRVVSGALCRDRVWMVRDGYLGFTGDLSFVDTQGASDPDYTGLASRFQLVWGS